MIDLKKHTPEEFSGEWLQFGSERFPNWDSILDNLLPRA